ncbi:hypothetical protein JYU14_03380 [Simkania negevensis]|uniref:Adenylate cyclase n=1 Tax=Simkania negevensis TaxID=83561 RepID=A0ABS3AQU7_9BACT|nr:hypothetical protein [Simkania negevensis]
MKLKHQLIISIGFIIFLGAILLFFIPRLLVVYDLEKADSEITQTIIQQGKIWKEKIAFPDHFDGAIIEKQELHAIINAAHNDIYNTIGKFSTNLLIIIAVVFCATIALIIIISNRITRPLTSLERATSGILEGNYIEVELPSSMVDCSEVAHLTKTFNNTIKGLQEKEKIRGLLNKVVSKEIAEEILNGGEIQLGGETRRVTVLFSDIRQFTAMTQEMPPQQIITLLNAYITRMSTVIDNNRGVIDKYVGDEIMALYGAPVAFDNHALHAINTAITMIDELKRWDVMREKSGQFSIDIGIGIHTGEVVAGNMGSTNRLNYTVLGSNVNLGARLCSAAAPMEILITTDTLNEPDVRKTIIVSEPRTIACKGFNKPVTVYSVLGTAH